MNYDTFSHSGWGAPPRQMANVRQKSHLYCFLSWFIRRNRQNSFAGRLLGSHRAECIPQSLDP